MRKESNTFPLSLVALYPMNSPAPFIDHTLLKADSTKGEVEKLCEEAVEHGFASVCIPPVYVPLAKQLLYGSEVAVSTVIGFPMGYQTTEVKVFETQQAIVSGADELDVVIHLGAARLEDYKYIKNEICRVVFASEAALVKVIIECGLFDNSIKYNLAKTVAETGAEYIKTSTGFGPSGATVEDIKLMAKAIPNSLKIKAAGGIRDWECCRSMLSSGASRIGTSAGVFIMEQWRKSLSLL